MRLLVAVAFLVAFLDALSTYAVITLGRGVEANPAVADVINSNPTAVFSLALISAAPMSIAVVVADRLLVRLTAALRVKVVRVLSAFYIAAILVRAAVVVNNLFLVV